MNNGGKTPHGLALRTNVHYTAHVPPVHVVQENRHATVPV